MVGAPALSTPLLTLLLHNKPTELSIKEAAALMNVNYFTLRNAFKWLEDRGYVAAGTKIGNAQKYSTPINSLQELEAITDKPYHEVIMTSPEVVKMATHVINGVPMEAWLRGYAEKPGRNENIKKQTDQIPLVIAALYNVALDKDIRLWNVQSRLDEIRTHFQEVVDAYNKMCGIAKAILNNPLIWDARYIKTLARFEDPGLPHSEVYALIEAVRRNYGGEEVADERSDENSSS
jgi:hypothetical protein